MFMKRDVILAQEYLAFMLLNVFDLFLTGYIFRHNGVELNGVAEWFIEYGSLRAFVWYKFFLVAVVVLACEGIAVKNVRRSRQVITGGCLIYVFVVLYECFQIILHMTHPQALG
ncbi:MAG: DUF5658 family protein [Capsulimonadaceae bacterium]